MKRFLAVLLSAVLLLTVLPTAVFAEETVDISVTADTAATERGETVKFTVSLGAVTETPVAGLTFELDIPEGFEYVVGSASIPTSLKTTLGADRVGFSEKSMRFVAVGGGKYTSSAPTTLLTFEAKALSAGTFDIGDKKTDIIGPIDVATAIIPTINSAAKSCTVVVAYKLLETDPQIVVNPSRKAAKRGDYIEVKVDIKNNPGVAGAKLTISYDAAGLEMVAFDDGKIVHDGGILGNANHKATISNPYTLTWQNSTSQYNSNGTLATLRFKVKDDAVLDNDYAIEIAIADMNDANGANVEMAAVSSSVRAVDFIYGDVNNDGEVDILDVTLLARYDAGWAGYDNIDLAAADVNCDGEIDILDVTILSRFDAGWAGYVLPYLD